MHKQTINPKLSPSPFYLLALLCLPIGVMVYGGFPLIASYVGWHIPLVFLLTLATICVISFKPIWKLGALISIKGWFYTIALRAGALALLTLSAILLCAGLIDLQRGPITYEGPCRVYNYSKNKNRYHHFRLAIPFGQNKSLVNGHWQEERAFSISRILYRDLATVQLGTELQNMACRPGLQIKYLKSLRVLVSAK